ncbi:hypothetical protein M3Y96_00491800 [Aphelenchoides besseyi]|nr:hypothetical protein M3Y96_00491800 [Aphelenchoides besseyi]
MNMQLTILFVALFPLILALRSTKPAHHIPHAIRARLPSSVAAAVEKLEFKDLKAANKLASHWSSFHSAEQFNRALSTESRQLKSLLDSVVKSIHDQIDKTVDEFNDDTIIFFRQAGNVLFQAKNKLERMYETAKPNVKRNIRQVFPKSTSVIERKFLKSPFAFTTSFRSTYSYGRRNSGNLGNAFGAFANGFNGAFGGGGNLNVAAQRLGRGWARLLG